MKKFLIMSLLFIICAIQVLADEIRVYDEYGNRIGTYKKEGMYYQMYDFNDNKIENPEKLIKNPPTQKMLEEYAQTFYDKNINPIGTWNTGYSGNNDRYYPNNVEFYSPIFYKTNSPSIVRTKVREY